MFQLLNPIWLSSIAAIAIPIIIHLWNTSPGKTLKIGSISLFGENTSKNSRSLKLTDWPLLILRCFIILLLAFLLSEPAWRQAIKNNGTKGWVLIEKEQLPQAYAQFKPSIDSAMKAGYKFHYFENGFPEADFDKAINGTSKIEKTKKPTNTYWPLLNALNQEVPSGFPVLLITDNQLNGFSGNRPAIAYNLNWKTYNSPNSTATWLNRAYFTFTDSLKVITGKSTPHGITYNLQTLNPALPNTVFQTAITAGKPVLKFKNPDSDSSTIEIDTSKVRIGIFADTYTNDAAYIQAAIAAVQKYTSKKIEVQTLRSGAIPSSLNWIFWLSEKPLPKLPPNTSVLKYETGTVKKVASWIEFGNGNFSDKPALSRRVVENNKNSKFENIWSDGFGNGLLVKENRAYHFYSHFDPDWNELVWNQDFPRQLLALVLGSDDIGSKLRDDRRIIDKAQQLPQYISAKSTIAAAGYNETNLQNAFWLAIFLAFLTERWISHKKSPASNG